MKTSLKHFIFLITLMTGAVSHAYEQHDMALPSGVDIETTVFTGDGENILLWLPSERGMRPGYVPIAMDLSTLGIDSWAAKLHESYMLEESRRSISEFPREDLLTYLELIRDKGFKRLTFITMGRGAVLAFEVARLWQEKYPDSDFLNGYIFFTPHLITKQPEMGHNAEYKEIAKSAVLPVYLIQAEYSTKYARSQEIAKAIGEGGSQVYIHSFPDVSGGFQMRPDEDLTQTDLLAKATLPDVIDRAINLLTRVDTAKRTQGTVIPELAVKTESSFQGRTLNPFQGNPQPLPLKLPSLYGGEKTLEQYKGKVILLNFWATWCGPCVREIPSLSRLVEEFKDQEFEVVTVNIGEPEEYIREFVKDLPVNFEILLDQEGQMVNDWNVYAYPSNFLIDATGKITHAYRGALEWDSPEVLKIIKAAF